MPHDFEILRDLMLTLDLEDPLAHHSGARKTVWDRMDVATRRKRNQGFMKAQAQVNALHAARRPVPK